MRTWLAVAAISSALAGAGSAGAEVRLLDRLVAEADGAIVTVSDIALGRALGLFGLTPTTGSLSPEEIQQYVDGQLLVREAARIGVEVTPADQAEAWAAVARRAGGDDALTRWLRLADVEVPWARRLVDDDLRMRRFIELRFRALAFISEADLAAVLGEEAHDEKAREATRGRLEAELAERRRAEWLAEARARASIRPHVAAIGQVLDPLPGPPGVAGRP
jgi:hypothetical protein